MIPNDVGAEEAVLGGMISSPFSREDALGLLRAEDFYKPFHGAVFEAIRSLVDRGAGVDPRLVRAAMLPLGVEADPKELTRLSMAGPASMNVRPHARIVAEMAARRRLIRESEILTSGAFDLSRDLTDVLDHAGAMVEHADLPPLGGTVSPDLDQFLAVTDPPRPWTIETTIRKRERLLVVAEPGGGKSTLLRQWAIQLSQGIHPFRIHRPLLPLNVLVVDLENEPSGSREELGPIRDEVRRLRGAEYEPGRLRIEFRPAGIDVTRRADAVWLMERVAANRPDVVVIGPTYKLHETDDNDAGEVRRIQKVLDLVRMRYDVALLMEAHAPKESFKRGGRITVAGSRLWTQWPEFIFGLQTIEDGKAAEWRPVRPPRYRRRDWPQKLRREGRGFPWTCDEMV